MVFFIVAIRKDLVSLLRLSFCSHIQVFSCVTLVSLLLKISIYLFSSHIFFLVFAVCLFVCLFFGNFFFVCLFFGDFFFLFPHHVVSGFCNDSFFAVFDIGFVLMHIHNPQCRWILVFLLFMRHTVSECYILDVYYKRLKW